MAQAMAYGFENLKPEPQAKVSQAHGLALAWPILLGLAWLLASRPSQHITNWDQAMMTSLSSHGLACPYSSNAALFVTKLGICSTMEFWRSALCFI